jgi:BASS family bile acid:Na+ symporter
MFDWYPEYEHRFAQIQLILFMLGMGATLDTADFVRIGKQPRHLIVGVIGQFLISPLIALLMIRLFNVPDGIAIGMILLSAMPGGNLSKAFTFLGRGNIALSISLTCFGMLACLITVPLLLRLLAADFIPADFAMPIGEVMVEMFFFLLLPLGLGMLIGQWWPERRHNLSRWFIRLGLVLVVTMIVCSIGAGRIHPTEYGWRTPVAIILFCIVSMQVAMLPFRLLGWSKPETLSVGIEVTMRNLNLALLLKAILFPAFEKGTDAIADGVLFVILYYAGVAFFAGIPLALNFRRWNRQAAASEAVTA